MIISNTQIKILYTRAHITGSPTNINTRVTGEQLNEFVRNFQKLQTMVKMGHNYTQGT